MTTITIICDGELTKSFPLSLFLFFYISLKNNRSTILPYSFFFLPYCVSFFYYFFFLFSFLVICFLSPLFFYFLSVSNIYVEKKNQLFIYEPYLFFFILDFFWMFSTRKKIYIFIIKT